MQSLSDAPFIKHLSQRKQALILSPFEFFYLQVQLQCSLAKLPKQQTLAPVLAQRNSNLQLPY